MYLQVAEGRDAAPRQSDESDAASCQPTTAASEAHNDAPCTKTCSTCKAMWWEQERALQLPLFGGASPPLVPPHHGAKHSLHSAAPLHRSEHLSYIQCSPLVVSHVKLRAPELPLADL